MTEYVCPECDATIEHLNVYRQEWGTVGFDEDGEVCYDSIEYGDSEEELCCPECNAFVDSARVKDEDEREDENEISFNNGIRNIVRKID